VDTELGIIGNLPPQARREIVDLINHEIRTPLTALLGHLELLEDADVELPYRLEISLRAIARSGDRLRELLSGIDELDASEGAVTRVAV
jgi:signal transduction histidine kinase